MPGPSLKKCLLAAGATAALAWGSSHARTLDLATLQAAATAPASASGLSTDRFGLDAPDMIGMVEGCPYPPRCD